MAKFIKVAFVNKSGWQKDDCINPECTNESALEAVASTDGTGKRESRVRCCKTVQCRQLASNLARVGVETMLESGL